MQTLESKRINSNKIKADYAGIIARIISSGSHKKTYFEILYHDTKDNEWHIGYGSYTYKFVENWLIEEFESGYKPISDAITDFLSRAQKAEMERDAAIETIFEWTGCPECKFWNSENNWCEKHDREADSSDGCNTPEWRGFMEG